MHTKKSAKCDGFSPRFQQKGEGGGKKNRTPFFSTPFFKKSLSLFLSLSAKSRRSLSSRRRVRNRPKTIKTRCSHLAFDSSRVDAPRPGRSRAREERKMTSEKKKMFVIAISIKRKRARYSHPIKREREREREPRTRVNSKRKAIEKNKSTPLFLCCSLFEEKEDDDVRAFKVSEKFLKVFAESCFSIIFPSEPETIFLLTPISPQYSKVCIHTRL